MSRPILTLVLNELLLNIYHICSGAFIYIYIRDYSEMNSMYFTHIQCYQINLHDSVISKKVKVDFMMNPVFLFSKLLDSLFCVKI